MGRFKGDGAWLKTNDCPSQWTNAQAAKGVIRFRSRGQFCMNWHGSIECFKIHDAFWLRLSDVDVFISQISSDRRLLADKTGADDSANVPRPSGSSFISLRHPPQSHQQEASLACILEHQRCWLDQAGVALGAAASRRSCRP